MPVDKLTIQQFAQKIKTKYPEYGDVEDSLLTQKIIDKYPEYKDMVHYDVSGTKTIQPSETPTPDASNYSGFGSRTFDIDHAAADNTVQNALNTKQASVAIDKLAKETFLNSNAKQSDQHSENQPIIKPDIQMLPQDVKASREAFQGVTDPSSQQGRTVLEDAKRLNEDPDYAKNLNSSFYIKDRGATANPEVHAKIKSGQYGYDLNKQKPTIELNPAQAFVQGLEDHYKEVQKADDLAGKSKEEIIADEEKDRETGMHDQDTPIPTSKGWASSLTNLAGENITGFVKAGSAAVLSGLAEVTTGGAATPALIPTLGALFMSHDAGKLAAGSTFTQVYHELRNKGMVPSEAYDTALQQAKFNGSTAAAQMALLSYSGIKSGSKPLGGAVYGKGFKELLKSQASNIIPAIKNLAPEIGIQASLAGGFKALENVNAGKPTGKDVPESMLGMATFLSALHTLGAVKESLTPRGKEIAMNGFANSNPDLVEQGINQLEVQKSLTPEQAAKLRVDLIAQRELNKGLPENVPEENKQKIKDLIEKRNDLENKINPDHADFQDEAFHKDIKEQINGVKKEKADGTTEGKDGINEKIRQLSKPTESPNFHENLHDEDLYQKPDIEGMVSKLPDTMQNMYKQDPEGFWKFIADQEHNGRRTELEEMDGMTKTLIDEAVKKYPEHTLSAPKIEKPLVSVIQPEENKAPNIVENVKSEPELIKAEEANGKPEITLERIPAADMVKNVSSDEYTKRRLAHTDIINKFKNVKRLIDCLWP